MIKQVSHPHVSLRRARMPSCAASFVAGGRPPSHGFPRLIVDFGREHLPSGKRLQFAIENGPVEILDLPINSMVDLSIVFC